MVLQEIKKSLIGMEYLGLPVGDTHGNGIVFAQGRQGFTQAYEGWALCGVAGSWTIVLFIVRQKRDSRYPAPLLTCWFTVKGYLTHNYRMPGRKMEEVFARIISINHRFWVGVFAIQRVFYTVDDRVQGAVE
jgi:hypothetical protein